MSTIKQLIDQHWRLGATNLKGGCIGLKNLNIKR